MSTKRKSRASSKADAAPARRRARAQGASAASTRMACEGDWELADCDGGTTARLGVIVDTDDRFSQGPIPVWLGGGPIVIGQHLSNDGKPYLRATLRDERLNLGWSSPISSMSTSSWAVRIDEHAIESLAEDIASKEPTDRLAPTEAEKCDRSAWLARVRRYCVLGREQHCEKEIISLDALQRQAGDGSVLSVPVELAGTFRELAACCNDGRTGTLTLQLVAHPEGDLLKGELQKICAVTCSPVTPLSLTLKRSSQR